MTAEKAKREHCEAVASEALSRLLIVGDERARVYLANLIAKERADAAAKARVDERRKVLEEACKAVCCQGVGLKDRRVHGHVPG